jgi:ribosomal protein L7/L12
MTPLLGVLEIKDYAIIAIIMVVFGGGATLAKGSNVKVQVLAAQIRELQKRLDLLLKHQGIEIPEPTSGLSPEVERLALEPSSKIAAIKLYRRQNPGTGLREAKEVIEAFQETRRRGR